MLSIYVKARKKVREQSPLDIFFILFVPRNNEYLNTRSQYGF
jgi:hypothetical protein